jgi:hypothetical protein
MDPGGSTAQKTTYSLTHLLVIGVVLLVAILLRLYTLDTSPNYDSMATFTETQNTTPKALSTYATMYNLRHLSTVDKSTLAHELNIGFPGYYVLNGWYVKWFGVKTFQQARVLTALLSILTVLILTVLAWVLIGPHGAIATAIIATFSPLFQFYGSYVRFYSALVFFSSLSYAVVMWLAVTPRRFARSTHVLLVTAAAVLAWIPLTVHAAGALPLFTCSYVLFVYVVRRLSTSGRVVVVVTYALVGLPVLANTAAFLYARATDTSVRTARNVMSSSIGSLIASIFFNFNGLIFLVIGAGLVLLPRSRLRFGLLYVPFLICLAGASLAIVLRHELFRPDYLSTLLPIAYILLADSIERIAASGPAPFARRMAYLVLCCVMLFSLPSFASNVVIDQDGLDFRLALRDINAIAQGRTALVYTHSPGYFPAAAGDHVKFAHLDEEGSISECDYGIIVYAIGWRREGFEKKFYSVVPENQMARILRESNLARISGHSRLDLRDNLVFLFRREPRTTNGPCR